MTTTKLHAALTAFAAFVSVAVLPSTASAGTVGLKGDRLEVKASKANNRLVIGRVGDRIRVEERNGDQGLNTSSSRCAREPVKDYIRVECPASAIRKVTVSTRGGNDWVVVGRGLPDSRTDRGNCSASKLGAKLVVALGEGNDVAELSAGADELRGEGGHDLLMGCAGNDHISGGPQGDRLSGDRGNDRLRAQGGSDSIVGCSFDPDDVNYPRGENGEDHLDGGEGNDFLFGCGGLDTFSAGGGDDNLNTRDDVGEVADCGEGSDVIYLDPEDSRPGCETVTDCVTDNYPIGPDTGLPECFGPRISFRRTRAG